MTAANTSSLRKRRLTDVECKAASLPPGKKLDRLSDEGYRLYLEVRASKLPDRPPSKRWYLRVPASKRTGQKETRLPLGAFPLVSLAAAREKCRALLVQEAAGVNIVAEHKNAKGSAAAGDTFGEVAEEWFAKRMADSTWADGGVRVRRFLDADLLPHLRHRPVQDIEQRELLDVLEKTAVRRGALETARRELTVAGQVFRYARNTGRAAKIIADEIKDELPKPIPRHFAARKKPQELAFILRAIRAYRGHSRVVPIALQLAPMLFQRPGNIRRMRWEQIDWESATWTIPSAEMKRSKEGKAIGEAHIVPLPRQAVALLEELRPHTDTPACGGWVFPNPRQRSRPLSPNALRTALMNSGRPKEEQGVHGFRATARTMLVQELGWDERYAEEQLAHSVRDANGRAYNRTDFLEQRRKMLQVWADYCDALADGGEPERAAELARAAKDGGAQQ